MRKHWGWWFGIPVENEETLGLVVLELATFKHIAGLSTVAFTS